MQHNTFCPFNSGNTLRNISAMNWREMIKMRMAETGLTQEQLAVRLDMTQGGLGHWLNGKRQPPFEKLIQIADILGLDRAKLGAALLDAGGDAVLEPAQGRPPAARKGSGRSQLVSRVVPEDLDLLQQVLDNQQQIHSDVVDLIREIRAAKAPATDGVGKKQAG